MSGSRLLSSLARLCRLRRPAVFLADRCASVPFFCGLQLFLSYFCPRSVFLRFLRNLVFERYFEILSVSPPFFCDLDDFSRLFHNFSALFRFLPFFRFPPFFRFSLFLHGPCRPRLAPVLSVALCVLLALLVASCCL